MAVSEDQKRDEEWLLGALAELIEAAGAETFLAAPLIEPTPAHFPDPFDNDVPGAERIAHRLLRYAGLRLQPLMNLDETQGAHGNTAAWFAGINLGRAVMGISDQILPAGDRVVATLAHEVAHVWRAVGKHADRDGDAESRLEEERLTDVTTVFLGFGILTTNGAYRFRASALGVGSVKGTRYQHDSL
ncbi:MAG: hypothetical protein JST92_09200, partial [Deltaproteobacteria bacterium]|nr:hypothetical protein [Deltaproteobacteria bacterium]